MLVGMAVSSPAKSATKTSARAAANNQTFVGEIEGPDENREWVEPILYDQTRSANFYVDDWKADRYIGHRVKITGTLDKKNEIIHPASIDVLD